MLYLQNNLHHATAVKVDVLTVVLPITQHLLHQNHDAVPEFVIDTPAGIVIVSPLSPNVTVPQFVLGLILFTFISLIIYLLKLISYYTIPDPPASPPTAPCEPPSVRTTTSSTTSISCSRSSCIVGTIGSITTTSSDHLEPAADGL